MATVLPPDRVAALRAAQLTYPSSASLGASPSGSQPGSLPGRPPTGFHAVRRTHVLRRRDFEGAAEDLMAWRLQERAGVRLAASDPVAAVGSVVELRLGLGPLAVRAPCRVVAVVDEPDRAGFAYGTLPGHPETGEEEFLVERQADGSLQVTVAAFSRPATRLARLGGPVTASVQRWVTGRYLRSLDG